MVIFGFMHICDATAGAAAGVLRGTGKQLIGALCNLVGFYFIGFPTGVSLMFAANMGIVGLWTGLAIGVSLQALVFVTFLCKLDWEKAAEEALVRAGVKITKEKEMVELEDTDLKQEGDANLEVHDSGHSRLQFTTTTVGHLLSVKQLVLRRGLTLLIMIVILTVGIVTSSLLVKQFK